MFSFSNISFSTIVTENRVKHFKYLSGLLNLNSTEELVSKLNLLYRASEHSFSANKFHQLCDEQGPTLTIVSCISKGFLFSSKRLFGGYASKSWFSGNISESAPGSFLFSLDKETKHEIYQKEKMAMQGWDNLGPSFGYHGDLDISDKCNSNASSLSNLGGTYSLPNGTLYKSRAAQEYFAGSDLFKVEEYEVYKILD